MKLTSLDAPRILNYTELSEAYNKMTKPIFVISMDLELGWGFILNPEHKTIKLLRNDPQYGRGAIELLLNLFQRHNVPATWAAVGHLFLEQGEGKKRIPRELPQFEEGWLNWDFYSQICDSPLFSAPDIIEKISNSQVNHEIGLHSFFHIPFSACSQAVARLEVELGMNSARKRGIIPQSFVFPENYVAQLDTLKEQGIAVYRGNIPRLCNERTNALIRKAAGAINKVTPPSVIPLYKNGIWEIPGSMSFDDPLMPFTLLPRAKIGLKRTVQANNVFHVWLHPWSLLMRKGVLDDLEAFLAYVSQERDKGNLQVMTMGDLATEA